MTKFLQCNFLDRKGWNHQGYPTPYFWWLPCQAGATPFSLLVENSCWIYHVVFMLYSFTYCNVVSLDKSIFKVYQRNPANVRVLKIEVKYLPMQLGDLYLQGRSMNEKGMNAEEVVSILGRLTHTSSWPLFGHILSQTGLLFQSLSIPVPNPANRFKNKDKWQGSQSWAQCQSYSLAVMLL